MMPANWTMHKTIRPIAVDLHFLPVVTRVPLKFGPETLTTVTCARVRMTVTDDHGHTAEGWGETPLSVQWVWPSQLPYEPRHQALKDFCVELAKAWATFRSSGHPLEIGHDFQQSLLPDLLAQFNSRCTIHPPISDNRHTNPSPSPDPRSTGILPVPQPRSTGISPVPQPRSTGVSPVPDPRSTGILPVPDPSGTDAFPVLPEPMPYLAALVCCSAFDIALHDAYGHLLELDTYQTYTRQFMSRDLAAYLTPAEGSLVSFADKYPADFLVQPRPRTLPAWHLVGGLDAIDFGDLTGDEPRDGYPVTLHDWIRADGLRCLKIKLRGNDARWDYSRLLRVGQMAIDMGVLWLTTDFNCTVTDPAYVNDILDRLRDEQPHIYAMILYVEQPFPYELESHRIDVHSVSARKPLFMDESAHDWRLVKLGRTLGWTGVALKTCKTQTGAILSLCWARAHGMTLMVQDLTNPMLAQIPHVLLAAHAGTIMGVETNSMQFYPAASDIEAKVHPGLYKRREGRIDLSTVRGPGFGYQLDQMARKLPTPAISCMK